MTVDSIGIDISKDRLDVFRLSDGARERFDNSPAGFCKLRRWLGHRPPARVIYEPTGACHGAFERACAGHLPLCKVNPLQARRFAQARGTRARSDAVDARMLALMGAAFALEPDQPMSEKQRELKELQVQRTALVKDRTRLMNRLKTQTLALTRKQSGPASPSSSASWRPSRPKSRPGLPRSARVPSASCTPSPASARPPPRQS